MKDEYYEATEEKKPQMIDLGLPSGTIWASCNIGASQPWEYGGYYAWGETEEKDVYNDVTYQYFEGENADGDGNYDKHVECEVLSENISGTEYDVAHVKSGDGWQMPTREQFMELLDNCSSEWIELHAVKGLKFIGPNGNSIFLPAGGCRENSNLKCLGDYGYYWSSMLPQKERFNAHNLVFCADYAYWYGFVGRNIGHSVRPVKNLIHEIDTIGGCYLVFSSSLNSVIPILS